MYAAVQAVNEKTGIRDILEETYGPEKSSSLIDYSMHSILNKTDVSNSFETKMRNELTCSSELRNDTYFSDLFENRMYEEHELLFKKKWAVQCRKDGAKGVYITLFFDYQNGSERVTSLLKKINGEIERVNNSGDNEIGNNFKNLLTKEIDSNGNEFVKIKTEELQKAINEKGLYSIITSDELKPKEIHDLYASRNASETQYMQIKSQLGYGVTRVHYTSGVRAKFTVVFIASVIRNELEQSTKKLGRTTNQMIQDRLYHAKNLFSRANPICIDFEAVTMYNYIKKRGDPMSALFKLLISPVMYISCRKRLDLRLYPALIGIGMFFALSVVRTVLRLGFPTDDAGTYYLLNGLASSVLEETARVIAFYYILKEYRNASDAVSHGIGHGALENLGAGITTIGLNMTAANAFLGCAGQLMGSCRHIALSVFAWYGVKNGRIKLMLPIAMVIHLAANIIASDAYEIISTIAVCTAAYFLYRTDEY